MKACYISLKFRKLDMEILRSLHEKVNVLPLIAKVDEKFTAYLCFDAVS